MNAEMNHYPSSNSMDLFFFKQSDLPFVYSWVVNRRGCTFIHTETYLYKTFNHWFARIFIIIVQLKHYHMWTRKHYNNSSSLSSTLEKSIIKVVEQHHMYTKGEESKTFRHIKEDTQGCTWFTPTLGLRPPKGVTCLWRFILLMLQSATS